MQMCVFETTQDSPLCVFRSLHGLPRKRC